jgi:hypothetical protein
MGCAGSKSVQEGEENKVEEIKNEGEGNQEQGENENPEQQPEGEEGA